MKRLPSRVPLAATILLVALASCASVDTTSTTFPSAGGTASVDPSEPPSASPTQPATPRQSDEASSPSGSAPAGGLAHDSMVVTVVDEIALRETPSTAGPLIGYLPTGARSFVVDGPESADGYTWMLIAGPGLPPASGCATFPTPELTCPAWFGWAAIADASSGDSWFADDSTDCPDPASGDSRAVMMLGDVEALHCYAGRQIELPGWLPAESLTDGPACAPDVADAAWLVCEPAAGMLYANREEEVTIGLYVDPGSEVDLSATTGQVTVIGHVDDPAAEACNSAFPGQPDNPLLRELNCRTKFVVDSVVSVAP